MARILWFAVGAAAGLAYASQLINKERLNLPPGSFELAQQQEAEAAKAAQPDFKTKLADTIDERADWLANLIDTQVMALTDRLHIAGHQLASKLRGEPTGELVMPGTVTIYGEAFIEEPPFASESADQGDTGFEANR